MSLLVLRYSGVSSRPLLPQESPCFSSASFSLLITDCGSNSNIKTSYNFTCEWRAVTPRKYKPIFFVRCKSCRSLPCPAGTKVFDGTSSAQSQHVSEDPTGLS